MQEKLEKNYYIKTEFQEIVAYCDLNRNDTNFRFALKFLQGIKDWKQNVSQPELPYIKTER